MFGGPEIVEAGPGDAGAVAALLDAINGYYDVAPLDPSVRDAQAAELTAGRYLDVLLARLRDAPVGLAIYTFVLPAGGDGPGLYLKEIFVTDAVRGRGVGRALFARLTAIAMARGCTRIDWTAESTNAGAMRFYADIGAERIEEKRYFRIPARRFASFRDALGFEDE